MRLFWLLPKAAPALLRHIGAYAELAALDLARAKREILAHLVTVAVLVIGVFFALLMGCLLVIAWTWDTPYRIAAIAWLGGGFLAIALLCILYRTKVARAHTPLFSSLRHEWQEDRIIFERLLSSDQE